jgi:hypothetical protein
MHELRRSYPTHQNACTRRTYCQISILAKECQPCRTYAISTSEKYTTLALSDSNKLDRSPCLITASKDIADHQVNAWLFHDLAQMSESCFLELCQAEMRLVRGHMSVETWRSSPRVPAGIRMRAHHCPVDFWRDSFEDFSIVTGLHVLEECFDLGA